MNVKLLAAAGGILLLGALAVAAYLKWDNAALRERLERQARDIGILALANDTQKTAIAALREEAAKSAATLLQAAKEKDELRAKARNLERRAEEALRHAATIRVSDPWPRAVRDALCLRWLATENRLPADYDPYAAAPSGNAETDPIARFCAAWDGLTPTDTVTWIGELLDHIGEMAIDRKALRRHSALR